MTNRLPVPKMGRSAVITPKRPGVKSLIYNILTCFARETNLWKLLISFNPERPENTNFGAKR